MGVLRADKDGRRLALKIDLQSHAHPAILVAAQPKEGRAHHLRRERADIIAAVIPDLNARLERFGGRASCWRSGGRRRRARRLPALRPSLDGRPVAGAAVVTVRVVVAAAVVVAGLVAGAAEWIIIAVPVAVLFVAAVPTRTLSVDREEVRTVATVSARVSQCTRVESLRASTGLASTGLASTETASASG